MLFLSPSSQFISKTKFLNKSKKKSKSGKDMQTSSADLHAVTFNSMNEKAEIITLQTSFKNISAFKSTGNDETFLCWSMATSTFLFSCAAVLATIQAESRDPDIIIDGQQDEKTDLRLVVVASSSQLLVYDIDSNSNDLLQSFQCKNTDSQEDTIVKIFAMNGNVLVLLFQSGLVLVKTLERNGSTLELLHENSYTSNYKQSMVLYQDVTVDDNLALLTQFIYDDEKMCSWSHVLDIPLNSLDASSENTAVKRITAESLPLSLSFATSEESTMSTKLVVAGQILNKKGAFFAVDQMGSLLFLSTLGSTDISKNAFTTISLLDYADIEKIHNISACCTQNGTIVIVCQKGSKTNIIAWETTFGTIQGHSELYDGAQLDYPELNSTSKFMLHDARGTSDPCFLLCTSSTSPESKYVNFMFQVIPYQAPGHISLLSALGRGMPAAKGTVCNSIIPVPPPQFSVKTKPLKAWNKKVQEWCSMDEAFLQKLCDPLQTPVVDSFTTTFVEWITSKINFIKSWAPGTTLPKLPKSKKSNITSLLHLPPVDFSQVALEKLMVRCTASPVSFWPRAVVEYLIVQIGGLECKLVQTLLDLNEIQLLRQIVDCLGVSELVLVLKWALTSNSDDGVLDGGEGDIPGHSLPVIQEEFVFLCFKSIGKIFSEEAAILLKDLTKSQVLVVFEWIKSIIDPPQTKMDMNGNVVDNLDKCVLWWAWNNVEALPFANINDLTQNEYEKWTTAIDTFALMIDAHISLIRLDTDLQCIITDLSSIVKRDSFLIRLFGRRLRGPLEATVSKEAVESHIAKSIAGKSGRVGGGRHGREWRKMVHQMEIGVGEYAVEVIEL